MLFKNYARLQSGLLDDLPPNDAPPADAPPADAPPAEPPADIPEFLKTIDAEMLKEPMLKNHKDLNSLVKSYIHAQKSIGKEKIVVPSAKSSAEEWERAFKALGKPEDITKYGVDTSKSKLGKEVADKILESAFANHMLPNQVKELLGTFESLMEGSKESAKANLDKRLAEELDGLKKEWADGYDKNMFYAKTALKEFADDNFKTYLKDSGLDKDVNLIKLFSKIGKAMGDDEFKGVGSESFNLTKDEIGARISEIKTKNSAALYDKTHQDHARIMQELENLYKKLN